ncbi:hypothetical protein P3X46_018724 [Hevea brasiliensis]|uniref:Protein kinase domain-containing protein n=1 Tax=Hevea brasiliensis TaxID=3981 RepID=A0ABQ9LTQ2_HEVBR|nr:probable receptor-like protein kinase At5g24010 [Hevea brasiliensis]KAJ9170630.1 hypothetical protein P3X46_018724 [Hevea brasiliensis]
MEKLQPCQILLNLFPILTIQFCFLILPSSGYTLPDKYFINCGSESPASLELQRSFVGDLSYWVGSSKAVKDSSQSENTSLYQTARVFHKSSSYHFDIDERGTYIIRLHFFAFSSPDANLASGLFNVQALGFQLLSDFSVSLSNSPMIKEFLFTLDRGKFVIDFRPSHKSSFAFVNAIEVFLTPESFIPDDTTQITAAGRKGNFSGLLCHGLHTTYRINVGGSKLTADNDKLWRNWIPDDDFLTYPETAENSLFFQGTLPSGPQNTEYVAPALVYKTAKKLRQTNFSNITWGFKVSNNSRHLVRVHFCDIISTQLGALRFYFHIYNNFSTNISSYDITGLNASPFYFDFVVESDNSGFLKVSVLQRNDSEIKDAFLNGLEIMEMLEKSQKPKKKTQPIMVGSVGAVLFVVVLLVGFLVILKSRRAKSYRTSGRPFSMPPYRGSSYNWSSERTANVSIDPDLKLALKIPYVEIQRATKNFNSKLMIGEGGFGKVYKGILREGVQVAVKRSEPGHGQGMLEFQTEIMVLSQIRHRHLVSLIGYCDEGSEMILVYEFMEKGSLRDHLYISDADSEKSTSRSELSWEQRLEICIDSAKGLHYLHTGLARRIIHRDVKSTNILLNEDYIAKVADFGLSKSGPLDPNENTGVKGSFGYLDPEYFMSLQLTEKSDVYSFGVVLLEVLCARPAIMTTNRVEEVNLAEWGMLWQKKGQLEKIVDPALVGTINFSSLRKFGETAEKCLRPNGAERPMMHDVLWDLEFALRLQQTSVHRRIDDDSMNSASLELAFLARHDLPSHREPAEEDDSFPGGDDSRITMASRVFSQLKIDAAR